METGRAALEMVVADGATLASERDRLTLAVGRNVVSLEAAALETLARTLDGTFAAAANILVATAGRVVVTGMGKSGHVGRKLAATFASTGSPAFFVHPAEASHGDLGMLMPGDTLVALSNSGETPEMKLILHFATTLGIPVIAIGSRARSTLMRQATVALLLPDLREACPANISPTTSAAMMLSLGDALAMAAMDLRGVTRATLHALHPGGSIGRRFLRVSAIMHGGDSLPLVGADTLMRHVIPTMTAASFGVCGVVDADGLLIGVITDGDLRRHIDDLLDQSAGDVMTHDPLTILASGVAEEALAMMESHKVTSLFVVDETDPMRPMGLVHIHDFLRQELR